MVFSKIGKSDYEMIYSYLKDCDIPICDYSGGAVIMWHQFYETEFCIDDGFLYLRDAGKEPAYSLPVGKGDFEKAVRKLEQFAVNGKLKLNSVIVEKAVELKKIYGDKMSYEFDRDVADYIYPVENMLTFGGNKLAGMRNHLNRFKKENPDYKFIKVDKNNVDRVKDFCVKYNATKDLSDKEARAEAEGIFTLLDNLDIIDGCAGLIEVNGNTVAISIGEYFCNSLIIHVEKADTSYNGCYQVMVNEFAKAFVNDRVEYINREDDVGIEGLRKSKLAYRPMRLLDKANVEIMV